jgi:hypothetical protein
MSKLIPMQSLNLNRAVYRITSKYWTVIVFNGVLLLCWFRAVWLHIILQQRINFFLIEISICY